MFLAFPPIFEPRILRMSLRGAYSVHACIHYIQYLISVADVGMDDLFDVTFPH